MSTYGARPEVIAIPVDEYKELLAANTELKIIYALHMMADRSNFFIMPSLSLAEKIK